MPLTEKQKEYRRRYKEKDAVYQKKYREANPGLDKKYYEKEYRVELNKRLRANDPIKYLLVGIKSRCKKNGIPFDITAADLEKPTHCPVLGIELAYCEPSRHHTPNSASLDRIIPSLGYVKGNVIVVSWRANELKKDATLAEMKALYDYYKDIITEEIYEHNTD